MKVRRSSSVRFQELADLDDILEAFDALDSDDCLPEIVCSAEDLLQMPQLLPLCSTEQVAEEMRDDVRSRQSGDFATVEESLSPSDSSTADRSVRPKPIVVKLSCPWDRRVILAGKMRLSEIDGIENYFLQPDLSLEERQKHRADYLARKSRCEVPRVSPGNV